MDNTPERRAGSLIIERYMPNATLEAKEEAYESLRRLARLIIRVHTRLAQERYEAARNLVSDGHVTAAEFEPRRGLDKIR